jgi:hypothetical protein
MRGVGGRRRLSPPDLSKRSFPMRTDHLTLISFIDLWRPVRGICRNPAASPTRRRALARSSFLVAACVHLMNSPNALRSDWRCPHTPHLHRPYALSPSLASSHRCSAVFQSWYDRSHVPRHFEASSTIVFNASINSGASFSDGARRHSAMPAACAMFLYRMSIS